MASSIGVFFILIKVSALMFFELTARLRNSARKLSHQVNTKTPEVEVLQELTL